MEIIITPYNIELKPSTVTFKIYTAGCTAVAGSGVSVHNDLTGRSAADQHPISSITGLTASLGAKANTANVLALDQTIPQTISNGTPSLNRTVAEITDPKHIITKEYLDARTRGGGGFLANLYFRSDASDIATYKRIDYEAEATETELTGIVKASDGTKLLRTYLFDEGVGTTILDAGIYVANYRIKLSSASGVTQMVLTAFVRHTDNSETDLFTAESVEINNTDYANVRSEYNAPSYNVVATDRFGVRISAKTTHASNITITTVIGDGYGSYFSTPVAIRHELLRGRDAIDSHPASAISGLATVATSGSYNDLSDTPTIPTKLTATITIAVADWSGGTTCTKTVSGLLVTDFVTPVMDRANLALYVAADITGELQAGQIVFTAATTPTSQIVVPINIIR